MRRIVRGRVPHLRMFKNSLIKYMQNLPEDAAQQELFQVVNAASAAAVQNIVNNITNNTVINNYTINIDQLNVHMK